MKPEPSWVEHADVIIPAVEYGVKVLVSCVVGSVGLLCAVIAWVGRQFGKKFNDMDAKIGAMHHIMLSCEGCAKSAENYHRRVTDQII